MHPVPLSRMRLASSTWGSKLYSSRILPFCNPICFLLTIMHHHERHDGFIPYIIHHTDCARIWKPAPWHDAGVVFIHKTEETETLLSLCRRDFEPLNFTKETTFSGSFIGIAYFMVENVKNIHLMKGGLQKGKSVWIMETKAKQQWFKNECGTSLSSDLLCQLE